MAAREAGQRVFVFDLDPQNSLARWGAIRKDETLPVQAITAGKLPRAIEALTKTKIDLVIIDTAGTESAGIDAAIKCADLCLIPARPTAFDLWASEQTRTKLKAMKREYCFVLNQCPALTESPRVQDGVKALEAMGGLLSPMIAARVDFQEAARHGLGVTEVNSAGKAAEEIRGLWHSLRRRLAKVKASKAKAAA